MYFWFLGFRNGGFFTGVDFIRVVLFSDAAFHAVTSFYLKICAYFVKLQNGSELDADIEVFTPAPVDACWVEFYLSDILYTIYEYICCQYM